MENITVKKADLLKTLTANRNKHREVFEQALEGYRDAVIEALEKRLDDARKGRKIDLRLYFQEPADQTKDYDRAIAMLNMSVEDKVNLSERDFAQYVLDDWAWKEQWIGSNSAYVMAAASKKR